MKKCSVRNLDGSRYIVFYIIAFALVSDLLVHSYRQTLVYSFMLTEAELRSHLSIISSDQMRGRGIGTPEIGYASDYLSEFYRDHGLKSLSKFNGYFQPFVLEKVLANPKMILNGHEISSGDFVDSNRQFENIVGVPFYLNPGDLVRPPSISLKNAVLVSYHPRIFNIDEFKDLSRALVSYARRYEAKGLIQVIQSKSSWNEIFSSFEQGLEYRSGDHEVLPHFYLKETTGVRSKIREKIDEIVISFTKFRKRSVECKNIGGLITGSDSILKHEFVVVSAHYDHLGIGESWSGDSIYNGARDNAIGVVAILNAISYFSKKPAKRSMIFLATTAEEVGLFGSRYFVENLPKRRHSIVFNFNSDGMGYNDKSLVSVIGLSSSPAKSLIIRGCKMFSLKADEPEQMKRLFANSDNFSFSEIGINSITFSPGVLKIDSEINRYYHKPQDHVEGLDFDYLKRFYGSFVRTLELIGNSDTKMNVDFNK